MALKNFSHEWISDALTRKNKNNWPFFPCGKVNKQTCKQRATVYCVIIARFKSIFVLICVLFRTLFGLFAYCGSHNTQSRVSMYVKLWHKRCSHFAAFCHWDLTSFTCKMCLTCRNIFVNWFTAKMPCLLLLFIILISVLFGNRNSAIK